MAKTDEESSEFSRGSVSGSRLCLDDRQVPGLLLLVSGTAAGVSTVLPSVRDVLVAIAGVGVFGAILAIAVMSERSVPAPVGTALSNTVAENQAAVAAALGYSGCPRYVPSTTEPVVVRLHLPPSDESNRPSDSELLATLGTGSADSGLSLTPTGRTLVRQAIATDGPLPESPYAAGQRLAETLTARFELARSIEFEMPTQGRLIVTTEESAIGDPTQLDHPIQSCLGVGLARVVDTDVRVDSHAGESNTVTYRWDESDA